VTPVLLDASAVVEYLLRTERAGRVEAIIQRSDVVLHIPALCDIEVASALRRALIHGRVSLGRVAEAIDDLRDLPLVRHGHQSLIERVLDLRNNFSAYDATYIALAERLGAALLTADGHLARAIQDHLTLVVIAAS